MASYSVERSYFLFFIVHATQLILLECAALPNISRNANVFHQKNVFRENEQGKVRMMPKIKDRAGLSYKLRNDERCREDIQSFCSAANQDKGNYELLLCLQNQIKEDELNDDCHQALWEYKNQLINNPIFEAPAEALCQDAWKNIDECKNVQPKTGELVPCLVENKDQIQNKRCKHVINKLAQILFTDYRLLKHFYQECDEDVKKFKCGRIDEEEGEVHTQGSTLECLEENEENLTKSCRHKVFRVAELQSDDYHMNRALYYACRGDREHFCSDVEAGEGRIYECLKKNKFSKEMSHECQEKLTTKQKIESKDHKANFPFMQSCKRAMRENECEAKGETPAELAKVLLCLEKAILNGAEVDGTCRQHMKDIQQQLMQDYSINPDIVANCETEIKTFCRKVEKGGKTLDCLMEKAMEKEGKDNNIEFSDKCYSAISNLLKETGAGGDFKIDATLQKACKEPARKLCPDAKNDMGMLSCLMENFESKDLGGACHEQLLHLQFFMARDFQLDESVYQACKSDADALCKNPHFGNDDKEIAPQAMTLSCLYRHMLPNMNPDPTLKVSSECAAVVMKTMHQRAADVRLMPQVQLRCITDLAKYCSENVEESDEVKCLQDNMEKLSDTCKESVGTVTEEESEDIDLDKSLVKHCSEMVKFFCSDLLKHNDADGILPCLYNNKYDHEMDHKCRAELEHKQLIEMKDYRFSSKFKKACRHDVQENCNTAKSKADVIKCLSLKVRSAVVDGEEHTISADCRKQLNVEKLRQAEDIKFDPELYGACADDVKKLCIHKHENGPAAVLECLKEFQDQLSDDCSRRIFEREKKEVSNPKLDVRLFKVCKPLIKKFCKDVSPNKILHCLEEHKRDMGDYDECREMVFTRQKNALKDIELMPGLAKACHKDIKDFCHEVTHNDQIIPCLKKNIKKLSSNCEEFVVNLEKEAALDYRLNPSLAKACANEIEEHCSEINPGHGEIMECLRNNYQDIKNTKCRAEIKEALIEERTDIMADPLLHETCFREATRFCHEISHGRGRILQCLLDALEKGQISKGECKTMLKSRQEMWSGFQLPPPESFVDLAAVINTSPQRNYFFVVFSCVLAIIFVGGLVSGRLTKRVAREVKNR